MLSEIHPKDENTDDILQFMGSSDLEEKNELASIIADMSSQISSGVIMTTTEKS